MSAIKELKENPVKYLKSVAMDIVVILVSLAYIFYQLLTFEKTQLNPLILIAEAIVGIICGIIIKQSLGENGFSKGYNSTLWTEEEEKYNDACTTAIDYIDRVDEFYTAIQKEKKMRYRMNHLQAVRLKYSQWFNNEGDYIGNNDAYDKLTFRQKWVLKKCIKVNIYVLNLFSEYATSSEQDTHPELTDNVQRRRTLTKNTLSAMIIAIIGVYFVPVLGKWNWANLIASSLQVSLWVLFGILQLYTNFNYVVQDKVSILREKKKLIARFVKDSEKGLYVNEEYKKITQQEPDQVVYISKEEQEERERKFNEMMNAKIVQAEPEPPVNNEPPINNDEQNKDPQ